MIIQDRLLEERDNHLKEKSGKGRTRLAMVVGCPFPRPLREIYVPVDYCVVQAMQDANK